MATKNTRVRTLGLDISTQSISAVILEVGPAGEGATVVAECSCRWADDPRLNHFGIDRSSMLVPPRVAGEADQPPLMFLAGLDAILDDLRSRGADLADVAAVSVSAQQHGHVYVNSRGCQAMDALGAGDGGGSGSPNLAARFEDGFAYGTAPIWQTSNSLEAADEIRRAVGGTAKVVAASGSDSPARFTGAVVRRTAQMHPAAWAETERLHLLSSFFAGVLAGTAACPIDWGNGSGMTLMDYRRREWSDELVAAVGAGLSDGGAGVHSRLPGLASPVDPVGNIAAYFVATYGFRPDCIVNAGSGDNPQSKVMTDGDLLSLGSSFVYMVDTGVPVVDEQGYANSMYDGLGRPFVFACRTNGAMVWDRLRATYGASLGDAEAALAAGAVGRDPVVWQPYAESYPVSPVLDVEECRRPVGSFETLYPAVVESTLILVRHYARGFERNSAVLSVTGGPSQSAGIVERVAAIFERPVVVVPASGAALGSAVSAFATFAAATGVEADLAMVRASLTPGERVEPDPALVRALGDGPIRETVARFESLAGAAN